MKKFLLLIALSAALLTLNFLSPQPAKATYVIIASAMDQWKSSFAEEEKNRGWKYTTAETGYSVAKLAYRTIKYGLPILVGFAVSYPLWKKRKRGYGEN